MLSALRPGLYASSLSEVDLVCLAAQGVKGIVFDIDNTVVRWGSRDLAPGVLEWIEQARSRGFRMCVLSNNFRRRVEHVSRALGIPAARGVKPLRSAFRSALATLGTAPGETAVIGDQLFTDVLGGNLAGMRTILVKPISERDFVTTRLVRRAERVALAWLSSRGMLRSAGGPDGRGVSACSSRS